MGKVVRGATEAFERTGEIPDTVQGMLDQYGVKVNIVAPPAAASPKFKTVPPCAPGSSTRQGNHAGRRGRPGTGEGGLFPVEPVLSAIGYHHSSWLGRSWFGTSSGGRQGLGGGKVDAARCL